MRVSRRQLADTRSGTRAPGDGERSSMNESNHLTHRILKSTEDGNGVTEVRDYILRRGRRIQRLAVHVEGMKRWLSRAVTFARRGLLVTWVSGYRIRVWRWLSGVVWLYIERLLRRG